MTDLKKLAKECLSIIETSILKDKEIEMLINSAKSDLKRVGIDVDNHLNDDLVVNTIMIYVKAHFGDTDIDKKEKYKRVYKSNLRELQFSEEYQIKEIDSNV